jgi:hypothetical protein
MMKPKVTFLIHFRGHGPLDGRWVVYDIDKHANPMLPQHALSDHDTFEDATKAANRIRFEQMAIQ